MVLLIIRTAILYFLVVIAMRVMGKRQIGQLQPFELVVILIISEMAAVSMQNTGIPITSSILPIITIVVLQVFLSLLNLKSEKARAVICGKPTILIENGKIKEDELRRARININDLLEQIRSKDCFNIADVEYGILETNGQLNILLKSQKRPVQPEDMKIATKYEGLPTTIIIDGQVNHDNLAKASLNEGWLRKELADKGVSDFKNVFFASLDSFGHLFVQLKENSGGRNK